MNYKFPIITHINDVLPAIEGRDEFIVAVREGYTVINYVVSMTHTFDMTGPDDLMGALRRECRGIIFDVDGNLISRPFHKFFNFGEREETMPYNIDITQPHVVMEKMDGSMIRPLVIKSINEQGYDNSVLRLGTKMGVTDVAAQAEEILNVAQAMYMEQQFLAGITPLFEFVSPKNKIVLNYDEARLVYLGSRINRTGEYFMCPFAHLYFDVVPMYSSVDGSLVAFIEKQKGLEGREGDIIRFADGHMGKNKNDWYVRIHKVLDRIRTERHVIDIALNEELDDVLPLLPDDDRVDVLTKVDKFWAALETKQKHLVSLIDIAEKKYGMDRKRIALEFVPTLASKTDAQFVFAAANGRHLRAGLLDKAKAAVSSSVNYDTFREWLLTSS